MQLRVQLECEGISKQFGRLNHLVSGNKRDAEGCGQFNGEGESKEVISAFAVELVSFHSINVRKNEIDSFLRKRIEGRAGRDDIPEKGVILLYMCLLIRSIGITEKHVSFQIASGIVFKGRNQAELTAIVCKDNGDDLRKGKSKSV